MERMTVARVRSLSTPGRYAAGPTLYLRVAPGGTKSWVQRLAIEGRRHDLGLGGWPLVTLAEARDVAFMNRRLVHQGGNPFSERRKAAVPTFREASRRALEANRGRWRNHKSIDNWIATMEKYAHPVFGDRRVDQIGREDVLRVLTPIWTTKPEIGRKVRTRIRQVLAWCQAHNYIENNPAGEAINAALPATTALKTNLRALPYGEVASALDTIAGSRSALAVRQCLRFVVLVASRSGEARLATWDEIDVEAREWRIPAARMKTGVEHRVPLSDAALAVLDAVRPLRGPADLLFPSPVRPGKPLSDMSLTRCLRDTGLAERAVVHGFRSSFRTWASERTSVPHAVCEMALAHRVGSDVERSYARSDLFEKRRGLMGQWAAFVTGGSAKVVRIRG